MGIQHPRPYEEKEPPRDVLLFVWSQEKPPLANHNPLRSNQRKIST